MGVARDASAGDNGTQYRRTRRDSINTLGMVVAGNGVSRWHREPSGSNRSGNVYSPNKGWGRSEAKFLDHEKNSAATARRTMVREALADYEQSRYDDEVEAARDEGYWDRNYARYMEDQFEEEWRSSIYFEEGRNSYPYSDYYDYDYGCGPDCDLCYPEDTEPRDYYAEMTAGAYDPEEWLTS